MITQVGKGGVVRPTVVIEEDLVNFDGRAKTAEELAEFTESLLDTRIPIGRTINNIPLDRDIVLTPEILDTYDRATIDHKIATAESSGYNPVKVNGHLLDKNVNLDASDLDAYSAQEIDSKLNFVPGTRTVNGKPLSADVTLTPTDVGAPTKAELDATVAGIVPKSRKVNGKPLSADVTLTPGDVGAPTPAETVPRTFTINGQAMTGTEMTVTLDSSAYTKAEIDTKLTSYIKLDNAWGLGTAPKVDVTATGSGFYGYTNISNPPGSSKGTTAYIFSADTSYGLAFPEDQEAPQYYNGTWHEVSSGKKAPIPDVWLPLEDSLRMITGEGPLDKVTINGSSLGLNTKSATFSRASTATYVSKDGIVKYAAIDEPRFEREGLLIETQVTNLAKTSTFATSMGTWFEPEPTGNVKVFGQPAPDGSNTALKVSFADVGMNTGDAGPMNVGTAYTLSFWAKNDTTTDIIFRLRIGTGDDGFLVTLPAGSNWTRLSRTYTFAAGDSIVRLYIDTRNTPVYIWGIQIEQGLHPTSFIPTAGTQVTRSADYCSIQSPGNFPGKDFTLAMNINYTVTDVHPGRRKLFAASQFYTLGFEGIDTNFPGDRGGGAFVYMGQVANGEYKGVPGLSTYNFDQSKPLVVRVSPQTKVSVYNGKKFPDIDIVPTAPVGDRLSLGYDAAESYWTHLNGHVRNVRIWLNQLSDSEIGALV